MANFLVGKVISIHNSIATVECASSRSFNRLRTTRRFVRKFRCKISSSLSVSVGDVVKIKEGIPSSATISWYLVDLLKGSSL